MRTGKIACYKEFILFSQCFPQLFIFSVSKCGILCGNWLTDIPLEVLNVHSQRTSSRRIECPNPLPDDIF